jgi:hypothetical protein
VSFGVVAEHGKANRALKVASQAVSGFPGSSARMALETPSKKSSGSRATRRIFFDQN